MKWREHAGLLLRKAAQDEYVLDRLLDDPGAPTEVFGFHAQQAAEKLLKSLLADHRVAFPHTHRIIELLDLLPEAGLTVPNELQDLRTLTPFAVEFRYDVLPEEKEAPLNTLLTRQTIARPRAWVESHLTR
ncbi:MAG: HEPN domain-containing protein [Planctomycetes bacterium]|nr:HEPN domain-containing protein [Planctomycetota bacterium]